MDVRDKIFVHFGKLLNLNLLESECDDSVIFQ